MFHVQSTDTCPICEKHYHMIPMQLDVPEGTKLANTWRVMMTSHQYPYHCMHHVCSDCNESMRKAERTICPLCGSSLNNQIAGESLQSQEQQTGKKQSNERVTRRELL